MPRHGRRNNFSDQNVFQSGGHGHGGTRDSNSPGGSGSSGTARNNNRNSHNNNNNRNQTHNRNNHNNNNNRRNQNQNHTAYNNGAGEPWSNRNRQGRNNNNHLNSGAHQGGRSSNNKHHHSNNRNGRYNSHGFRAPNPAHLTSSSEEDTPSPPHCPAALPQNVYGSLGELYTSQPIPGLSLADYGEVYSAAAPPPIQVPDQYDIQHYSRQPGHVAGLDDDEDRAPKQDTFTGYLAALASTIPDFNELLALGPGLDPASPPCPQHYCVDGDGDVAMHNASCDCAMHQLPQWVVDHIAVLERANVTLRGVGWASTVWDRLWAEPEVRWALATVVKAGIIECMYSQAAREAGASADPDFSDSEVT